MFVQVRDITVNIRVDGPKGAPALLLLHSVGTSTDIWDGQVAALSRGFRVIRPDMRGHGLTTSTPGPYTIEGLATDALAVLDALGIEKAHVAGVSIGGLIAQGIALAAPDRVNSLMLIDTAPVFPTSASWRERAALVRAGGVAQLADAVMSRWITAAGLESSAAKGLRTIFLRTDPEGYAAACEALAACDFSARLSEIAARTLVIVGEEDTASPIATARVLADGIPDAELVIVPEASHIPTVEKPEEITKAMMAFLSAPNKALDLYETGMVVRKQVLGEAHVARASAAITDFDKDFQTFITRTAWAQLWSRPNFDRRTRSIVTLAILAGLGHEEEFDLHVKASRNTGCTDEDIAELLLHVAIYGGIPAANTAIRRAKMVLAELAKASH